MMFERTWDILSDVDLDKLKGIAHNYGLEELKVNRACGHLNLDNPPIHWANRKYTFGNMIFRRGCD